jgi:pantetheine-phosphate adenylyltransferase
MSKEAIYAVSGDPWTKGHTDIVERSLQIFDRVIVAIGINPKKKYSFPIELRKKLAEVSLGHLGDRVNVVSFQGLLVDFAYEIGSKVLIRGIRDDIDFNFERGMFQVNSSQRGIEEIFLFPSKEYEHISSSAVRELQQNQGNILKYVDIRVKQAMEVHLSNQRLIGVTGLVGAGKSYIANKLCEIGRESTAINFHNIELDVIGRDLLTKDVRPFALTMRHELINAWQDNFLLIDSKDPQYFIDVKKLSKKIFANQNDLETYNIISEKPILFELQQQLIGKTGVIFINSALLIEAGLTPLCNNNILFITADESFRLENLKSRGYSGVDLDGRMKGQFSETLKLKKFDSLLEKNPGKIIKIRNSNIFSNLNLERIIKEILQVTGI